MFAWQVYAASPALKDKIALRDHSQGDVFSWAELALSIGQCAEGLTAQGLKPGQGLALCGKNSFDLLCHYLAGLQLGARVLGINPAFTPQKRQELCARNHISLCILFEPPLAEGVAAGQKKIEKKHRSFPLATEYIASDLPLSPYTLTLTSGSTGLPKAVVHDIAAHFANARGVCELTEFGSGNSWLLSLPLYHVSGQGIVWRWLYSGAELHLAAADFYASVARATHVSLVPTQLSRFLAYLAEKGKQNVNTRHILLGGSQIPLALTQELAHWGICSYSGYGMTEMASTVFAKKSDGSKGVGQALNQREYLLVGEELWLRGAGLAKGYWQQGTIVPLTNEQGWLQTKDKARWVKGELEILGRLDNMFISGGENIQPEEIEGIIQQFGGVKQVFVLPKNDPEYGQRPVALIAFETRFDMEQVNKLKLWLSDKIEKYKQPVAYFPLHSEKLQEGAIKISRQRLQAELIQLLGK
ncbi:o-succinylbenzoate--CoA ligase [Mesocricetibacter intestinalis]|nr:o-succinylbenzoate--CoA ligase [Mesocricetibacter intestinalis]